VEAQFTALPRRDSYLYFETGVTAFRIGKNRHALAIGKCARQLRTFRREKANRGQHGASWYLDWNLGKKTG